MACRLKRSDDLNHEAHEEHEDYFLPFVIFVNFVVDGSKSYHRWPIIKSTTCSVLPR